MPSNALGLGPRKLRAFVVSLALCATASCTDDRTSNEQPPRQASETSTLVIGTVADPKTLHPFYGSVQTETEVTDLIFESLVRLEPDFTFSPALAKSWEMSPDGLTLTFRLREDVVWHDGAPFTADDVAFTHKLATDPEAGSSLRRLKENIESCKAVDRHTVEFRFSRVYVDRMLDAAAGRIIPRHILEGVSASELAKHEFNQAPIGTGPWRLASWERGRLVRLEAFDRHYLGRPPIDAIVFRPVPEAQTRVLLMKSGDLDLVTRLAASDYAELVKRPDLVGHALPDRVYYGVFWNLRRELFATPDVRKALTLAIDREQLVRTLFDGRGDVCHGPVAPLLWGHTKDLPRVPHDPKEASRLLAKAGWARGTDGVLVKNGKRFSFKLVANAGNQLKEDAMTLVQSMLAKVGVEAELEIIEASVYKERFDSGDFDATLGGWGVSLKMDLGNIWKSDGRLNVIGYSNPEVDRLIDEALLAPDYETALPLWKRVQELIVADHPYTFLFIPQQLNVIHARFKNVRMEPLGWNYNIHEWTESRAESD